MSEPLQGEEWRRQSAETLRAALQQLRARLLRHADALDKGGWLVAVDDASLAVEEPARDPLPPTLRSIAELAGLGDFESDLLLLAAAPSLDGTFARACAELHNDAVRNHATLHLALSLFVGDPTNRLLAADCLMPSRPLRALRLVEVDDDEREPLLIRRLGVDARISDYLRGVNRIDERVAAVIGALRETLPTHGASAAGSDAAALIKAAPGAWSSINLVGESGGGTREAARLACAAVELRPMLLDLERFAACSPAERARLIALMGREAVLADVAIVVDAGDVDRRSASAIAVEELLVSLAATLFVISAERWPGAHGMPAVQVSRATRVEQRGLWRAALAAQTHSVNGEIDVITQQFDLGAEAIVDVVSRTARREGGITGRSLWAACREQTGSALDDLARRVTPSYGWNDIVVNDDVRAQLRELAAQVQQRGRVYESWGFGAQLGRGRGITALFAGPSGTGKTMAAEIIASHLELDLYRIDLAGVVSKYIGETEKNLRRVFDAAERSGAILFFDEADSLFGSRTEARDSHDRYSNLEINYLLQRMEDYAGLAILATNRRSALDTAFLRRLRFVIDFPFPAADDRRRIWERVFPAEAAVEGLERSLLSGLDLSGGNIRSIAVNAAFLAASDDAPIGMRHVVKAAAREYAKLSKPISAAEFGSYYGMASR